MKQSINLFLPLVILLLTFTVTPEAGASLAEQLQSVKQITQNKADNHHWILPLGRIKKDRNLERDLPAEYKRFTGQFSATVWELIDGVSLKEARQILSQWLQQDQFEALFQCQSRDCGESFAWANSMFNQSLLYGNDRSQNLWVVKDKLSRRYHVYYLIERPNRRIYFYEESLFVPEKTLDLSAMEALLKSRGAVTVAELPLQNSAQELDRLVEKVMELNLSDKALLLVVHRHGTALQQGGAVAQQLEKRLKESGFKQAQVKDVANLAPSGDVTEACWIEWVDPVWAP